VFRRFTALPRLPHRRVGSFDVVSKANSIEQWMGIAMTHELGLNFS
jgi:hypothetical protein